MDDNYQEKLLGLTGERAPSAIKSYLENLPDTKKGHVFEWYIAELFKGNGWLAKVQGGRNDKGADILLYHPKTPSDVSLIVQTKNWATPLSFDDTKIELVKFEEKGSLKHKCYQFELISINGYVSQAKDLQEFNMLLKGWDYVENLINKYDPVNTAEPEIELFAHNQITYYAVQRLWEKDRSVAVIQATGTGKSYIIAKIMTDFSAEEKLVMAPSHYILRQQESKIPWAIQSTTFMTYAKGANLTPMEISQLNCKLIVLDEFHRCGADVWGAGVQKILETFPDAHILGTSATPIRYLDNSRDMSDELFNSNVAENLPLAEAIVRRILPSPTYISALYTLDEETESILTALDNSQKPESEKKQLALEVKKARLNWENTSGIPEILKKHLVPGINKVIVFCRNEEHLDEMEAEVPRWFQKAKSHRWRKIYRVLSADSASDTNLEEFRSANNRDTLHLLFAIDMLNEGLHIPDVGAVILLRPTESPIIFYQQIGRCMQVDTAHTPTIFDFVNNFKSIKSNDFLKDLETCNDIQNARRNSFGLPQRALNVRIIDETKEIMTVFEIIAGQIHPFEVGLEYLKQYAHEYGHSRIPRNHKTSSGYSLGSWAHSRRWEYNKGVLSAERIKAFEALPGWTWDGLDAYFQEGFQHLMQYVHEYGDARVTYKYKTTSGYPLGVWTVARRLEYKKGMMPDERVKALEAITGWVWDQYEEYFRDGLEQLKRYVYENGHARVPKNHKTSSGFKLGSWVMPRRVEYNKGILPDERIKDLEAITGWVWDTKKAYFQEGVESLKQYIHENGHARVPKNHKTSSGFKLGSWVNARRMQYNKGILPDKK
jgi:superfamily II DNA or RNA helicase